MSRVLRIQEGGYKIITQPGSEIKLDTGLGTGQVVVTGDLIVEGNRTELNVQTLDVEDRIIVINNVPNSTSNGIEPVSGDRTAGIEIKRGVAPPVRMIFDELSEPIYTNNTFATKGTFVFKDTDERIQGISAEYVQNPTGSIFFNLGNDEDYKLQVRTSGTSFPYHTRIGEDEDIPNIKYIREYVRAEAGAAIIEQFYRYVDDGTGNFISVKTGARAEDDLAGDDSTGTLFVVGTGSNYLTRTENKVGLMDINGLLVGDPTSPSGKKLKMYVDRFNTLDFDVGISTENSNLVIAPETGVVEIRKVVHIEQLSGGDVEPVPLDGKSILYTKEEQGAGGTGIYFHSQTTDGISNIYSSGEICSAAKALVYGLIF
jgi:hypothetical protein